MDRPMVWRFYAYRVSVSNGFWLPVGTLYLQAVRGFGVDQIGIVMGGFSMALISAGGVAKFLAGQVAETVGIVRFLVVVGVAIPVLAAVLWVAVSPVRGGDRSPEGRTGDPAVSD